MTVKLAAKETLPEDHLQFLVQLSMLEIHLTEKRISRIAESVDPYDQRGLARLMPVMSRYDQDIEHMKTVISRLTTYMPFYERLLTIETALTDREMDKIEKELHPASRGQRGGGTDLPACGPTPFWTGSTSTWSRSSTRPRCCGPRRWNWSARRTCFPP